MNPARSSGRLYLIPMPLGPGEPADCLPAAALAVIGRLHRFIAEDARTARRVLSRMALAAPVQALTFAELNEHTPASALSALIDPLRAGEDVGLVSEAGCPVVADPGAALVGLAHANGIQVVPLVGPSAPLLALMASGLSGQSFRFHGYLPVDASARKTAIQALERDSISTGCTHLFIETPYRNLQMLTALLATLAPATALAVCADLTTDNEIIVSRPVSAWRAAPSPDIDRRPAVFVVSAARSATAPVRRSRRSP
jgi:16S rRNA (cytidine1402-2'-O)-methyltransferase